MANTSYSEPTETVSDNNVEEDEFSDEMEAVAIVGMALRVPGASNLEQFWQNLSDGVESTTFFSDEQLREAGVSESDLSDPDFVKAFGLLEGAELFDNDFFDILPSEAEILDPQHRQMLECSWEALEHAGYGPGSQSFKAAGRVGILSGVGLNNYLLHNLIGRNDLIDTLGGWQITLANDKDFAATRVAYKLNLSGAAMNVSTACSTSLVSVAMACQSLLSYQSDMILAGGCSIHLPQDQGYMYHPGGTLSSDGHCRAFDEKAQGTFDGNGVAMVVLKRLDDAIEDRDTIYGVVKGFAVNNDGAQKVGYTAPSVEGQSSVIREAQEMANVNADSISYIETHGTGTDLGDQVEITALTEAFREAGITTNQHCGLGSVKTNIGHLDTAAGTSSLIKTVLSLKNGQIPPSLHFTKANPKLNLETSPFYVNAALRDWPRLNEEPRRAGVSSFGIGGTNAHLVIEEAPDTVESDSLSCNGRPWQILAISGKTEVAVQNNSHRLADWLDQESENSLTNIAYTSQVGRCAFKHRQIVISQSLQNASEKLKSSSNNKVIQGVSTESSPTIVFMFPGQDSQYSGMVETLYKDEPLFKKHVDLCAEIVLREHGIDLMARMFSEDRDPGEPTFALDPLPIFVTEYALANCWFELGVQPKAMMGNSMGEYVCACLSGVVSLEDSLMLAISSGRLFSVLKPGPLLSVSISASEIQPLLGDGLGLSMVTTPKQCVVGGKPEAVAVLRTQLTEKDISYVDIPLGLPFHTEFMQPFIDPYRAQLQKVKFNAPKIPFVSCVTGDWIKPEQAMDPEHYLRLACETIQLANGFEQVFLVEDSIFLEVGPTQNMSSFAMLQNGRPEGENVKILSSLADPRYSAGQSIESADLYHFQSAIAQLWVSGVDINWSALYDIKNDVQNQGQRPKRVALPNYAFEHKHYWVKPKAIENLPDKAISTGTAVAKQTDLAQWFYRTSWQELPVQTAESLSGKWLVVGERTDFANDLLEHIEKAGASVTFYASSCLETAAEWDSVFKEMGAKEHPFEHIVYLGLLQQKITDDLSLNEKNLLSSGYYSVLALGQALGSSVFSGSVKLTLLNQNSLSIGGGKVSPANSAIIGPLLVLPQEYPNLHCRMIDVLVPELPWQRLRLLDDLVVELSAQEPIVALRSGQRWIENVEPYTDVLTPEVRSNNKNVFVDKGTYLITGGLGNIGLSLAECIARQTSEVNLVLTSRRASLETDSERAKKVKMLEDLGAIVHVATADSSDLSSMTTLIAETEQRFTSINGVIHAAGLVGEESFATVSESTREFCMKQFKPKIDGVRILEQVLGDRQLDFCILCSSLASILGGLGFAAYAAANAYMDSFVIAHNQTHPTRWISVDWEGWRFEESLDSSQVGTSVEELGMSSSEGVEIFQRILLLPHMDRIVISSGDLNQRIEQWVAPKGELSPVIENAAQHSRPSLLGEYVAPNGDVELQIAQLWESLLGIKGIGADDSFFELGGNSLLLTQLLAQIRKTFRLEISLTSLFDRPTIADIAHLIIEVQQESADAEAEREEWVI